MTPLHMPSHVTPGQAGALTVWAIIVALVAVWLYRLGFFRGWRARDAKGGAVRMDVIRGSLFRKAPKPAPYRSRRDPIVFAVPPDPDHPDAVERG